MQPYSFVVSGVRSKGQSNEGQRQECFWCKAYNDAQALAWAAKHREPYLHSFEIESKEAVDL